MQTECDLTVEIVKRIADAEGVSPANLGWALADYVDVEAINRLVYLGHDDHAVSVEFEVPGYEVAVAEGSVELSAVA